MLIKQYLVKYNLDVFVQDVISYNDLRRYKPSKEFFEQASKIANNVLQAIMLIPSNRLSLHFHFIHFMFNHDRV